ncbi:MAG: spermidine/putrescine transporter, ATP-binding protein [Actinomycetota bacterium]
MITSPDGASTDEALRIEDLSRRIDDRLIVDHVGFTLSRGELLTLVGPSGCGKSTLLRMIAGLEPADSGRVVLAGRDVSSLPPEDRRIGFVFQESALFGHLRVDQNVAFGLKHLGRSQRKDRVEEMLDLVKLSGLGRRYPHQLSGGEQHRVALARALAPGPAVVLLDEPFASLDEVLREDLGHQVADILRSTDTASILVTHDRHEALTLGDRVAVMQAGRIHQCGTPQEVYARPADRFVAGFVEVASFLDDGGEVKVARPHQIDVEPGGPDTVRRVEFIGSSLRYTIERADGSIVVSDRGPTTPLEVGEQCSVRVLADQLYSID